MISSEKLPVAGLFVIGLLAAGCGSGVSQFDDTSTKPDKGEESPAPARTVMSEPAAAPTDLHAEMVDDQILLTWTGQIAGDYNLDETVNGMDVFRISSRFRERSSFRGFPPDNPDNDCIDGNRDGVIDGKDLFLISSNFQTTAAGFYLYRSVDQEPAVRMNDEPVPCQAPIFPACSAPYEYVDDSGPAAEVRYSISCVGEGGAEGDPSGDTIFFNPAMAETLALSVTDVTATSLKLWCEVINMRSPSLGVTTAINYDPAVLSADDEYDGHMAPDNPWPDGLDLFAPQMNPASMTWSGLEAVQADGHIFYIEFDVIGGHGDTTDFTFVRAISVLAEPSGVEFRQPQVYVDALDVEIP